MAQHDGPAATPVPPRTGEQLSAWLDDELPAAELELLLARCRAEDGGGAAARATLARYALVSAALRGAAEPAALPLADRVAATLAVAPAGRAARPTRFAGFGLAAALAGAIAVTAALAPEQDAIPVLATAPAAPAIRPAGTATLPPEQFTRYLVYHGEYSGSLSAALVDTHIVSYHPAVAPVVQQ